MTPQTTVSSAHESRYTFHTLQTFKVGSPDKARDHFTFVTHGSGMHTLQSSSEEATAVSLSHTWTAVFHTSIYLKSPMYDGF